MSIEGSGREGDAPRTSQSRATLELGAPPSAQSSQQDSARPRPSSRPLPSRVGDRYRVTSLLGRGGSAAVYAVTDERSGRELALKQLVLQGPDRQGLGSLFEREYHVLAQLAHPSVIEVYDYAIDERGPFYTMELLPGDDLRELSPLPWQRVCALIYDVASSLALVHSRRLLHRDVSARNIRCDANGHAKLIDFGAMTPMGAAGQLVGTAPFVPPESMHRGVLDARTDLYSLGATMYYALTRRMAYPARDFTSLPRAWATRPPLPSAFDTSIPPALDALVMSLLSLEPAMRPRSAFEVMEKLAVMARLPRCESAQVARAYLSTPTLLARDREVGALTTQLRRLNGGRGGVFVVEGASGIGRSRLLDACALEAKTLGVTVLHVAAELSDAPFAAPQRLGEQLLEALPDAALAALRAEDLSAQLLCDGPEPDDELMPRAQRLRDLSAPDIDRAVTQNALERWFLRVGRARSLALLVDDVHALDDASVAWLAALAQKADDRKLLLVVALERDVVVRAPQALALLRARRESLVLEPLGAEQSMALLESVFGDVPYLTLLAARVHDVARGNPRTTMALAQYLLDRGVVRYEGGAFILPERLDDDALPASGADAYAKRLEALTPLARDIVETQALAMQAALRREQYVRLFPSATAREIDAALTELVSAEVLASDGRVYRLRHRGWSAALALADTQRVARHCALAELYDVPDRSQLLAVHHLLLGEQPERALEVFRVFAQRHSIEEQDLPGADEALVNVALMADIYRRVLRTLQQLQRPIAEQMYLRARLLAISIATSEEHYYAVADELLAQIRHDSGLALWESMSDVADPGARLGAALTKAFERYNQTPESERVYAPGDAIKLLVRYVAVSIAIAGYTLDAAVLRSLPGLIAPFTPLSKIAAALYQNALATCDLTCLGRGLAARSRWITTYEMLGEISGDEVRYVRYIRNAVAYAIGNVESALGIAGAVRWAETLDQDPMQHVSAMYLRRIMALQQGDQAHAEDFRKRAEVLAVQNATRQMFTGLYPVELNAYALSEDLTGVRELIERFKALARRARAWNAYVCLSEGYYDRLRGDLPAALAAFERGFPFAAPDSVEQRRALTCWPRLIAAKVETLLALGEVREAASFARESLTRWQTFELDLGGHEISRALALAEGRCGDFVSAALRLDALIAEQRALGICGLNLGVSLEARTRVAIWAGDLAAVEEYGNATAREYRHGRGSPLGARYERLMEEARAAGMHALPQLSAFETKIAMLLGPHDRAGYDGLVASVEQRFRDANGPAERARRALRMACDARGATAGHLFLGTRDRLELVASIGLTAAPELKAAMLEHMNAHAVPEDVCTAVHTSHASGMPSTTRISGRERAPLLTPLLLSCAHGDGVVTVGVLALELSERQQTTQSTTPLLEALALVLLRSGDIPGRPS